MKKSYITPSVEIVEVRTESLMVASMSLPVDKDDMITGDDMAGSKDHHFDLWGDDED